MAVEIPRAEFARRREQAAAEAAARGLSGLLVWSKGGGMMDRFADVMYLANHYGYFPHIQDHPPHWSGRSYSALVLPVDGEPALLVDIPDYRDDLVAVDDVQYSLNLPGLAARVLREKGMDRGRIGLVARESLVLGLWQQLCAELPGAQWAAADDILSRQRMVKSPAEQAAIRQAAAIGSDVVTAILEHAHAGVTEAQAVAEGYRVAASRGAMATVLAASGPYSHCYVRGRAPCFDSVRPMADGDLFHVDMYGSLDGYFFDLTRSTVIGRQPTREQRAILEDNIALIDQVMAAIRPGITCEDAFAVGQAFMATHGYAGRQDGEVVAALAESFPAFGHGIGLGWEDPWIVPGDRTVIQPGMVLAVECFLGRPGLGAAGFEELILVGEQGNESLITAPKRWWD